MKAQLVYQDKIGGSISLKEEELKTLDQYTYNRFSSESEIIKEFLNLEQKAKDPKHSLIKITYVPADLPFAELYHYSLKGSILTESQSLPVIYNHNIKKPDQLNYMKDIQIMLNDVEQVKTLHDIFGGALTKEEEFQYQSGMAVNEPELYLKGLQRWISEVASGEEGYFFTRMIASGISTISQEGRATDFSLHDYCMKKNRKEK